MKKVIASVLLFSVLMLCLPFLSFVGGESEKKTAEYATYLLLRTKTGTVEQLSPTDYIIGVVAAEMPISYEPEALKAQAVAAHTYALRQIDASLSVPDKSLQGAHLSDDPGRFQAYLSREERQTLWGDQFEQNEDRLHRAVTAVIHEVMTYGDVPIVAAFHAISGGKTENCETVWAESLPYLQSVISEGDLLSPDYQVTVNRTADEVKAAFLRHCPELVLSEVPGDWLKVVDRSEAGTVQTLQVGNQTVTGQEARSLLGLRSADFTVSFTGSEFLFTTKGYGHGVGLSQYGADYMARQGATYREILSHFYTGVTFDTLV